MNFLDLLVLIIFSSNYLGDGSSENLSFAQTDSSEVPQLEDAQENYNGRNEDDSDTLVNSNLSEEHLLNDSTLLKEESAKKYVLDRLFKIQQYDFEDDYRNEEPKLNQSPMRRQINSWETSDELFDSNNIPLSLDASYPRTDYSHVQTEYSDEAYQLDANQKNASYIEEPDGNYQVEPPQYYQKNYYYNYYPLIRGRYDQRKYNAQKFGSEEEILNSEARNKNEKLHEKKLRKKNPCKLYLQFLKYAFKELDKNSEYYDDLNEEYTDDMEADGSHRVFATQLLGPTLYIDNSGRVFQVNSKGNSIQTVEGISPSEKNFARPKLTTTNSLNEFKGEMPTNQPFQNSFIVTYKRPSVEMNVNTESYHVNEKELQTAISDKKHKKEYPTSMPTGAERATTFTEPFFLTTTSVPKLHQEEDYARSGIHWTEPNETPYKSNSSVGSPLYLHRPSSLHPNPTMPSISSDKNHFYAETVVSFENSNKRGNIDVDCKDKMLPCPDTFNITYPLNGYCNRYVSCESGVATRRMCSNGFHFNIITKSCDFPHNSICSYYCPEPNGHFGIPGDCSGYFVCENSIPEYRMCPPRMHWDVSISSCTFAALSSCPMKCSGLNEIKPYKGDCKAYVICLNGIPYYHKCPPSLIYNSENQTCVPENHFKCKDDPKLMTKTSNPSSLCKNVDQKLGTKAWCSYYFLPENVKS